MNFNSRHIVAFSLAAGTIFGIFVGAKVLPTFKFLNSTPPTAQETAAASDARKGLERDLAMTLLQSDNVVAASVHLAGNRASVTVTFSESGVRPEQVETIAQMIGTGGGLQAGDVSVFDSKGTQLNRTAVQKFEQKKFWTGLAINVAKVLGILAALVTARFIIQVIQKGGCGTGDTT